MQRGQFLLSGFIQRITIGQFGQLVVTLGLILGQNALDGIEPFQLHLLDGVVTKIAGGRRAFRTQRVLPVIVSTRKTLFRSAFVMVSIHAPAWGATRRPTSWPQMV